MSVFRRGATWWVVAALVLLGVLGFLLFVAATPHGVGLGLDSVQYVSAARNLAAGEGLGRYTCSGFKPLTQWAPLYPSLLAAFSLVGIDAIPAARIVGAFGYAATVILAGLVLLASGRGPLYSLAASLVVLSSSSVLNAFTWAMSEQLYVPLALAMLVALGTYLDRGDRRLLFAAGAGTAAAILTRYAGIALMLSSLLALAVDRRLQRVRLGSMALISGAGLVPVVILWARNYLLTGGLLYGRASLYPGARGTIKVMARLAIEWFLPNADEVGILAIGAALLVWAGLAVVGLVATLGRGSKPAMPIPGGAEVAFWAHSVVFPLVVLASVSFLNQSIVLDSRLFVPLQAGFLLLLVLLISRVPIAFRRGLGLLAILPVAFLIVSSFLQQIAHVASLSADGQGFASIRWQSTPMEAYLKDLPDVPIYTNDIQAVYFLSGKPSCALPNSTSLATLEIMRPRLQSEGGVMLVFGRFSSEFLPLDVVTEGLEVIETFPDAVVYGQEGPR